MWGILKYFPIYEEAIIHIRLCNCSIPEFPYIWGKLYFLFYQCVLLCLLLSFILDGETCCLVSKFPFLETMAGGWGDEEVAGLPHCSPPAYSAQNNGSHILNRRKSPKPSSLGPSKSPFPPLTQLTWEWGWNRDSPNEGAMSMGFF